MDFKPKTYGELYGPAVQVTTEQEAEEQLAILIDYQLAAAEHEGKLLSMSEAIHIVFQNLGYIAGYYDADTRKRVYTLYRTEHPIFGATTPTTKDAFQVGKREANRDQKL